MSERQARAPPAVARGLRGERDLRGSSVALSIALRSASSLVDRRGLIVTTERSGPSTTSCAVVPHEHGRVPGVPAPVLPRNGRTVRSPRTSDPRWGYPSGG